MKTAESYALQLLRSRSYEDYLAVLFAPADKRNALTGLYAFRQEILSVVHQVKEPVLGEMRLHYWQESLKSAFNKNGELAGKTPQSIRVEELADIFTGVKQNPVVKILEGAADHYNLSIDVFLRLSEAASFNLYRDPMPNRVAWEGYCNDIYSSVLRLACQILDKNHSARENIDAACHYGGLAQGLAAIIYDLPRAVRQQRQPVPQDILHIIGVEWSALYALSGTDNHTTQAQIETEIANDALTRQNSEKIPIQDIYSVIGKRLAEILFASFWEYYEAFKQSEKHLPAILRPAFLPLVILPGFIKQAEKQPHQLLTATPCLSPLRKQGRILRAALLGRF